jgi:hypothetical protein
MTSPASSLSPQRARDARGHGKGPSAATSHVCGGRGTVLCAPGLRAGSQWPQPQSSPVRADAVGTVPQDSATRPFRNPTCPPNGGQGCFQNRRLTTKRPLPRGSARGGEVVRRGRGTAARYRPGIGRVSLPGRAAAAADEATTSGVGAQHQSDGWRSKTRARTGTARGHRRHDAHDRRRRCSDGRGPCSPTVPGRHPRVLFVRDRGASSVEKTLAPSSSHTPA